MRFARVVVCLLYGLLLCAVSGNVDAQTERRADVPSSMLFDNWPEWKQRHEAIVETVKRTQDARVVFIGDSITHFWEGPGREVWDKYYAPRKAINLGISGDQVQYCMWRLERGELEGLKPRVAVVMISTNNCWGDEFPAEQTVEGIRLLVAQLRKHLPESKILLLSIFPREDLPEAMRAKPAAVSKAISTLHDGRNVFFLDIGKSFLGADGHIPREVMGDLLHPTTAGYRIWAEAMEPTLAKLMGERPVRPERNPQTDTDPDPFASWLNF